MEVVGQRGFAEVSLQTLLSTRNENADRKRIYAQRQFSASRRALSSSGILSSRVCPSS